MCRKHHVYTENVSKTPCVDRKCVEKELVKISSVPTNHHRRRHPERRTARPTHTAPAPTAPSRRTDCPPPIHFPSARPIFCCRRRSLVSVSGFLRFVIHRFPAPVLPPARLESSGSTILEAVYIALGTVLHSCLSSLSSCSTR